VNHRHGPSGHCCYGSSPISLLLRRLCPHVVTHLQTFVQELGTNVKKWREAVLVCRIKSAWAKDTEKLLVQLSPVYKQSQEFLIEALEAIGCQHKHGLAPQSNLERQAQRILDQIKD